MSVSKVVASLAVGLLEAAAKLAYESSVRDYLPELSEQWNPCTVSDVLDMASGVQCPEVGDPGAYLVRPIRFTSSRRAWVGVTQAVST
jgi:CubicO group peptidase (beta-lactamase class C family)